ncbi:MAG: hypothetical protein QGG40_00275, partial [Myxococcota bacterium]|nr:hypothetical protein [Myxococcota bacterium]
QEHSDGYWLHVARFQLWPRDDLDGRLQAISVLPCHSPAFVIKVTETETHTTLTEGPFAASSEEALMTYALLQGEIQADYRAQGVAMPEVPDCETGTASVTP